MDKELFDSKYQIFEEELSNLKDEKYITDVQYQEMSRAYRQYYDNKINPSETKDIADNNEQENQALHIIKETPVKEKIVLTSEQIRERNITWTLILGVIMLLIGGLIVATNNWNMMNGPMKVISIAAVSVLFLGLSWFSGKVLKISKTSFAFLTLGSLFIPIIFLAVGYLQLFGSWLSLQGEGKYILGLIGATVSLIFYSFIAQKYQSRLFKWLALLTSTITVGYGLASLRLSVDVFYLGIMLYNAFLLFTYYKFKNHSNIKWFSKEIPYYAQLNLIVSSLLMLCFFQNHVFYSFNVLLAAILYMSMIFVFQSKHYHFVFTALIVYGIYQLTSHTPLEHLKEVLFAAISFIYVGLQSFTKNHHYLKKAFQWTSAVLSFFSFVYITVQTLMMGSIHSGFMMFLATCMIAMNYIYLTNVTNNKWFQYLAAIFTVASGYELYSTLKIWANYFEVFMFIYNSIVFYFYFLRNNYKYLQKLKDAALWVTSGAYTAILLTALFHEKWLVLCLLFFAISILAYITALRSNWIKHIAEWVSPLGLLFSLITCSHAITYINALESPVYFALSGVVLLLISYLLKKINQMNMAKHSFYIAQGIYLLAILCIPLTFHIDWKYVVPLLLLGGIVMFTLLSKFTKKHLFWLFVAGASAFFYLSLMNLLGILDTENRAILAVYLLLLPAIMIVLSKWSLLKVNKAAFSFYWVGQGFSVITFAVVFFMILFAHLNPALLVIPLFMYVYCSIDSKNERNKHIQLYISLFIIPILIWLYFRFYQLSSDYNDYIFVLSVIVIGPAWYFVNPLWKNRFEKLLIPYTMVAVMLPIIELNSKLHTLNVLTFIVIAFNLYIIHKRKLDWLPIIPLLQLVAMTVMANEKYHFHIMTYTVLLTSVILVLKFVGEKKYNHLTFNRYFDWYTAVAFILTIIFEMHVWDSYVHLVFKIIPSLLSTYLIYSQIKRRSTSLSKNIVKTAAMLSLLVTYYKIVNEVIDYVTPYLHMELYVMPFVLLTIGLKLKVWNNKI